MGQFRRAQKAPTLTLMFLMFLVAEDIVRVPLPLGRASGGGRTCREILRRQLWTLLEGVPSAKIRLNCHRRLSIVRHKLGAVAVVVGVAVAVAVAVAVVAAVAAAAVAEARAVTFTWSRRQRRPRLTRGHWALGAVRCAARKPLVGRSYVVVSVRSARALLRLGGAGAVCSGGCGRACA